MSSTPRDYSVFHNLNFERKPVGVKYSLKKPDGTEQLDESLALCELFAEAQTSKPFYAARENIQCGRHVLLIRTHETKLAHLSERGELALSRSKKRGSATISR